MKNVMLFLISSLFLGYAAESLEACTKVTYTGPNKTILTARSMDWKTDIGTNIWVFPRGIDRNGATGPNTIKWKSKYGSVIATAYDVCTTDGINEKGLVANLLWLAESKYPAWNGKAPALSIAAWTQYVLDNFATVDEATSELANERFVVVTSNLPGQKNLATLHLAISDATGDNAIFEYIDGKLTIHHSPQFKVMTNSPIFEKQIALNEYWSQVGAKMLPGTNRASDRFARASFYNDSTKQTDDLDSALAIVFSVIRNCSVPFSMQTDGQPNISTTLWRTVADQKNLVYYFESSFGLNLLWIDLKKLDLNETGKVLKLNLVGKGRITGSAEVNLVPSEPFRFAGVK